MKRILGWVLVCALMGGLLMQPALAAPFPDVEETAPYAEAAETVRELEIMIGDEKGNFNPNKAVTRAEMAAIVCRMLGETDNLITSETFLDVPPTHWSNAYISRAAELKIINGYGNGNFGPSDPVTYEQAVTMLVRFLDYEYEAKSAGGYPDGYIMIAQNLGLLEGINIKNGTALDRGNVAIIIYNCYHSYI